MGSLSPSPWSTDHECGDESVLDANGFMVADCAIFGPGSSAERNAANARAVAALPALLGYVRDAAEKGCQRAVALLGDVT